ncbi:Lipase EstA/Esterase EstB family-containing protein [Aphelenchoides besseyi]|nr:Lipase EstA/Esterase EstB family-containing protein [Aphelenchoides besseyi]
MYGLFLLIVLICPQTTLATISSSFYSFIQTNFGQQVADQMARNDFGQRGNIPVIFVHGFLTTAGTTQPMATYFKQNYAYGDDELYATTFGRPAGSIPVQTALTCEYVKAAIKGGRCVDTGEELGPSLTSLVNAYLGVAGAMKGAQSCTLPFGICNTLNGMSCGSQFLNDINSQHIPTIFVHGYGQKASNYEEVARAFKQYGNMDDSELYATTYGELQNPWISMNPFLSASPFTFQMHTAIMGGKCVDANEDLGAPLTSTVNAYLGVSGAQRGCKACGMMTFASCNMLDGVHCGSKFLNDINSKCMVYCTCKCVQQERLKLNSIFSPKEPNERKRRVLLISSVHCTISSSFYEFIQSKYGSATAQLVARRDINGGSYGGGHHKAGEKTKKKPVIFVHGYMTKAATTLYMAQTFKQRYGYNDAELYATTYGRGVGATAIQSAMRCEHVKGVRSLIKAVAKYTNMKVNVIGYSMAIKGGRCVDTNENLGGPLTDIVHAYVGVAGAQRGARSCGIGAGVCNLINGMNCRSRFISDINSSSGYEGHKRYVIQSSSDQVVGVTNLCGQRSSEFAGATKIVTLSGLSHIQTCTTTAAIQHSLITKGTQG